MNVEALPRRLYRVHNNSIGPLEPPSQTGGFRFDDFRETAARFYVLYTGYDPETCMIEKLQSFAAGDKEARAIVDAMPDIKGDTVLPPPNRVSRDFLNQLAVSRLVADDERSIVEICGRDSLLALPRLASDLGIDGVPDPLKAGDIMQSSYAVSQRCSVAVHDSTDHAGIRSRSSLDDPADAPGMHINYSLYRLIPKDGGHLRVPLTRDETKLLIHPDHTNDLMRAIGFLRLEFV